MRLWFSLLLLLAVPVVVAAEQLRVVATTTFVADLVRAVGEPEVEVVGLIPHGIDPHLFKPTISDVNHLLRADVVLFNGLGLEGRMADVLRRLEGRGKVVVAVAEAIPPQARLADEDNPNVADPHVWFDPRLWAKAVDPVVAALATADRDHAELFMKRGEVLKEEYIELHAWADELLSWIPEERRILVTSHDAFQYFGRAYDMEVIGVQGLSTVSEAGLADIANIGDRVRQRQIPAIFIETSVSPAAIRRISRDVGVEIGGTLYSDSMGLPDRRRHEESGIEYDPGTYVGAFRHNVLTIADALR